MKFVPLLFTLIASVVTSATDFSLPQNPAKILESEQLQLSVESQFTTEPKAKMVTLSAFNPIGLYQSTALQVKNHFKRAGYEGTIVTGSYAINPFKTFDFGASLSYLTYRDDRRHHNGTMSLGVNYRFPLSSRWGEHHLGFSANNLFAVPVEDTEELLEPLSLQVEWQGDLFDRRLKLSSALGANLEENSLLYDLDLRFRPSIFEIGIGKTEDSWHASGGVRLLNLDVRVGYEDFDGEQVLTAYTSKRFGGAREDIYARKWGVDGCKHYPNLWTVSLKYYIQNEYLNAISVFGKLVTEYPNYFQNPMAIYYIARSYQKLDSREVAMQNAFKCLSNYPASKAVPYANLLLLELSVADGVMEMAEEYYRKIAKGTKSDSLISAADYHMGRGYIETSNFTLAEQFLSKVPASSKEYEKAQAELKIVHYLRSSDLELSKLESFCKIDEYYELRAEYAEFSMKYDELVLTHETSYIIEQKELMKLKMHELFLKMATYRQYIEDEKERILQLTNGTK